MRITDNQRIAQLENKYGIMIYADDYYNPMSGKFVKRYRMQSADGCCWEKGLSYRQLFEECRRWGKQLLSIKNKEN